MQPGYDQWTGSDVAQEFRPLVRLRRTRGDMAMVFEMWVMLSFVKGVGGISSAMRVTPTTFNRAWTIGACNRLARYEFVVHSATKLIQAR